MKVLFIMLIPLIVTLPILVISLIFKVNQASALIQIGTSLLRAIPSVLIAPFATLLALETMIRLEDEVLPKGLSEEPSESKSESKSESQVDSY